MIEASINPPSVAADSCVGEITYEVAPDWPCRTAAVAWTEVAAVAVDSRDRLHVFARDPHRILVFDERGTFLHAWGEGLFARPHGLTIDAADRLYCTDDLDHTVKVFSAEGRLLMTLGTSGKPAPTGATSVDYRTIRRAGPPFHFPTNVAVGLDGSIYVSDGYGNARIHRFDADVRLRHSWGEPGSRPGQFHVPHGIAIDREGIVYVADRENSRIQLFTADGAYIDELTDVARPCQVTFDDEGHCFVAELGYRAGMWPGTQAPFPDATGGRVSVFDTAGRLLARFGGGLNPTAAGDFYAPHDVCVDSRGNLFVAEVVMSAGGNRGLVSADCHTLQKFICRRPRLRNEG